MAEQQESEELKQKKEMLRSKFANPIARLDNCANRLEALSRKSGDLLPGAEAASFSAAVAQIIALLDSAKGHLQKSRDNVSAISKVNS
jgi:vacuolar-type H+-ATPase subunit D/Vma8